jgi:hypothetical protein
MKSCLAVTDAATSTVMSKSYKQALYQRDDVLKILFNDRFSKELERELKSFLKPTEWSDFVSACKKDFRIWWPHLYGVEPKKPNTTVVVENNTIIEQSLEKTTFSIEKSDRKFQYNSKKALSRKNKDKEHRQKKQEKKKQERKEKKRKQKQVEKDRYQKKILASIDKINLSRQWEYDEIYELGYIQWSDFEDDRDYDYDSYSDYWYRIDVRTEARYSYNIWPNIDYNDDYSTDNDSLNNWYDGE